MDLKTFADAEAALAPYVPLAHEIIGKDITLERMLPLMQAVGNPEKRLKVVHVAGTSGKTSTSYYIASLLHVAGKKVGLTVSPHMDSIAERAQVNLLNLDEAIFCDELGRFLRLIETLSAKPTYYELLMAFAYWYFDKAGVDYAVIETGLGGLHDGSNVAKRADKVCVITDIGYDHMAILGSTLDQIAQQKAGIIHEGNEVFMYQQPAEVIDTVQGYVEEKHAHLNLFDEPALAAAIRQPEFSSMPSFKQRNWLLAKATYDYIANRDALPALTDHAFVKTFNTYIPGRMDIVSINYKTIVMDGAHNSQKMQALVNSFKIRYPGKKATVLIAMKQSKDYTDVLEILAPITSGLVATNFDISQDRPSASVGPELLVQKATLAGVEVTKVIVDPAEAFDVCLGETPEGGLLLITGSLYLLSNLRKLRKELRHA